MMREKYIKILIVILLAVTIGFVWTVTWPEFSKDERIYGRESRESFFPSLIVDGEQPVEEEAKPPVLGGDLTAEDWEYLILVNKEHPVDENYKPQDLADIKYFAADRDPSGRFLRAKAADAFHTMIEAAKEAGYEIVMTTAYRSYGFQSVLYNNYVAKEGQEAADTYSAQPGKSEHQTGLAADVSSPSVNYQLVQEYGQTEEGKWLAEHASEYGFIIRFPEGKEPITGYMYEPWHVRYVGLTAAKEIYENRLTLEEYLDKVSKAE